MDSTTKAAIEELRRVLASHIIEGDPEARGLGVAWEVDLDADDPVRCSHCGGEFDSHRPCPVCGGGFDP